MCFIIYIFWPLARDNNLLVSDIMPSYDSVLSNIAGKNVVVIPSENVAKLNALGIEQGIRSVGCSAYHF